MAPTGERILVLLPSSHHAGPDGLSLTGRSSEFAQFNAAHSPFFIGNITQQVSGSDPQRGSRQMTNAIGLRWGLNDDVFGLR